jgi:hypothetical protein
MSDMKLDAVSLIKETMESIIKDCEKAYPNGYLDDDDAHTAISRIKARARTLLTLLKHVKRAEPTPPTSNTNSASQDET